MILTYLKLAFWSLLLIVASSASLSSQASSLAQSLDPNGIIGIEAIVAAGTDAAFYSRFGHAMLRFVKADGNFSTDIVVSLEADLQGTKVDALKGLDGGYQTVASLHTFGDFWVEYVTEEERPLQRFVIPTTPAMRKQLIATLQSWINNPSEAGKYTFLNNNCVGALAKLLEKSGFPKTVGLNPIIPTHIDNWLKHSLLSFYPSLDMESPKALYEKAAKALNISTLDFQAGRNWPKGAATVLNANFADLDVKRLLLELNKIPADTRRALVAVHNFGNGGANLEQAMAFQAVPNELYQVCADANCMASLVKSALQLWPRDALKNAIHEDQFVYSLVVKNTENDSDTNADNASDLENYNAPVSNFSSNLRIIPELIIHEQLFLRAVTGQ